MLVGAQRANKMDERIKTQDNGKIGIVQYYAVVKRFVVRSCMFHAV